MSLFVNNLSSTVTSDILENLFKEYGNCKVNFKGTYAFVDFNQEKDANDAYENLKGKNVEGREIKIEWNRNGRNNSPHIRSFTGKCYRCGQRGQRRRLSTYQMHIPCGTLQGRC